MMDAKQVCRAMEALPLEKEVCLMEVCGTHTMAIAKSGIRSMLPKGVKLLSGPGCPVCVTPSTDIDAVLALSMRSDVILATYGDMVRVPGSTPGDNLARRRALGAQIRVVYSPADAVELAKQNPGKEVVFLGVGFETTAPGTAAAALTAKEEGVSNFTVFSMLKTVEPALRTLMGMKGFRVQGFLCPGHVATIVGEKGFAFLPEEYEMPAVISGFEPEEILLAIWHLLLQIADHAPKLENDYKRAVSPKGNLLAQKMMNTCFEKKTADWRGLGIIPASGLNFRKEYSELDAERRFAEFLGEKVRSAAGDSPVKSACRCGEIITGQLSPIQCPLFGKHCVPEDPVGPCMVSSEGACAAAYKYMDYQSFNENG